jgi:hypothetical protein
MFMEARGNKVFIHHYKIINTDNNIYKLLNRRKYTI